MQVKKKDYLWKRCTAEEFIRILRFYDARAILNLRVFLPMVRFRVMRPRVLSSDVLAAYVKQRNKSEKC